jgi:hypothetical protein
VAAGRRWKSLIEKYLTGMRLALSLEGIIAHDVRLGSSLNLAVSFLVNWEEKLLRRSFCRKQLT